MKNNNNKRKERKRILVIPAFLCIIIIIIIITSCIFSNLSVFHLHHHHLFLLLLFILLRLSLFLKYDSLNTSPSTLPPSSVDGVVAVHPWRRAGRHLPELSQVRSCAGGCLRTLPAAALFTLSRRLPSPFMHLSSAILLFVLPSPHALSSPFTYLPIPYSSSPSPTMSENGEENGDRWPLTSRLLRRFIQLEVVHVSLTVLIVI